MVNEKQYIALIGYDSEIVDRIRFSGLLILLIEHKENINSEMLRNVDDVILINYNDTEMLIKNISIFKKSGKIIKFAISNYDFGLKAMSSINNFLSLKYGNESAIKYTRDKFMMRRDIEKAASIPCAEVKSKESVNAFIAQYGYPAIIKPRNGLGSYEIYLIENRNDEENFVFYSKEMLIEKFIQGRLFSVEAFSCCNSHIIVAVVEEYILGKNDFFGNFFLKNGYSFQPNISDFTLEKIANFVYSLLVQLDVHSGPTHTEVILDSNGDVFLVESHCRMAGGGIADLINFVTGIDLYEVWLDYLIDGKCFNDPIIYKRKYSTKIVKKYFSFNPGIIKFIAGINKFKMHKNIISLELNLSVGDAVPLLRSSQDRYGSVTAIGKTIEEAYDTVNNVIGSIIIDVETGISLKI